MMSTMEILFLVFTLPGIYIAIMLGVYKLYRKLLTTDDDIEDARVAAALWIVTLPIFVIVLGVTWILGYLFNMIDRDNHK